MSHQPLPRPDHAGAKKSPCIECQRFQFLRFIEDTKPPEWQQIQVKLREPCPCEPVKQYADDIKAECDAPPSNFWHIFEHMESDYDIYESFIRSFGFSGSTEVKKLSSNKILTILSERMKR